MKSPNENMLFDHFHSKKVVTTCENFALTKFFVG